MVSPPITLRLGAGKERLFFSSQLGKKLKEKRKNTYCTKKANHDDDPTSGQQRQTSITNAEDISTATQQDQNGHTTWTDADEDPKEPSTEDQAQNA